MRTLILTILIFVISCATNNPVVKEKAIAVITENIHRFDFNVGALQENMSMSRGHLHRKLVALTGYSSANLIRVLRLKAAESLLRDEGNSPLAISFNTLYCIRCPEGFEGWQYLCRSFLG